MLLSMSQLLIRTHSFMLSVFMPISESSHFHHPCFYHLKKKNPKSFTESLFNKQAQYPARQHLPKKSQELYGDPETQVHKSYADLTDWDRGLGTTSSGMGPAKGGLLMVMTLCTQISM